MQTLQTTSLHIKALDVPGVAAALDPTATTSAKPTMKPVRAWQPGKQDTAWLARCRELAEARGLIGTAQWRHIASEESNDQEHELSVPSGSYSDILYTVKAEAQQIQHAEQTESAAAATAPSEPALVRRPTYCPECVQRAQSNRLTRVLMHGIQALCQEHQRLEDYLPLPDDSYPADTPANSASAQNAQLLIRRIPVQFAEPNQAVEADGQLQSTGSRILVGSEGNGWQAFKIYIDPVDPIWN